jgi:uncharacterized membrane protein YkvA (DUF1232 family)
MEEKRVCGHCGKALGSNVDCLPCRDAAARELSDSARDVTDEDRVRGRAQAGERFARRPPWYARLAPRSLLPRLELLSMLLGDYAARRYRRLPWRSIAVAAAAVAYVVSPLDLIPDFLVPVGLTDDMLVLLVAWQVMKHDLREYCQWKGLAASRYGL